MWYSTSMLSGLKTRSLGLNTLGTTKPPASSQSVQVGRPSTASWVQPVLSKVNKTCSRPQRNVHRPGFEPGTPWSEIRRPNHCATLLPHRSLVMRKPGFCIYENKDADQLRVYREAEMRLCFRYTDITIPLLPKSEISSLKPSSVVVQPGLCRTWSETPKAGFLITRLIGISCFC